MNTFNHLLKRRINKNTTSTKTMNPTTKGHASSMLVPVCIWLIRHCFDPVLYGILSSSFIEPLLMNTLIQMHIFRMIPFTICPVKSTIWLRFHPTLWTFDNKHLICGSDIRYYFDLWSCSTTFPKYVSHTITTFVNALFKTIAFHFVSVLPTAFSTSPTKETPLL